MLSKDNRIKKDKIFKRVMSSGKKFYSSNSIWFFIPDPNLKKIGFIVSNKVSNKATRRNRIKRILRATIREKFDELPKGQLVVMIRKDYSSKELLKQDCLTQIKKLKNNSKQI